MADTCLEVAIYGFHRVERRFEEAGLAYELNATLDRLALGLPTAPVLSDAHRAAYERQRDFGDEEEEAEEVVDPEHHFDPDDEAYRKYLAALCPKSWKDQDQYRVLGLSKLRYKATPGQIKTCYRQKVLRYHPDKGKHRDELGDNANDAFACIQKAYEFMSDEDKRLSYDSVDPQFDESTPESSDVNATNFFDVLRPVFERNARFSKVQPVPELGDAKSSRTHVEDFYEFWYSFPSWREFSFLDQEDKSKGEDRYERREIEKQNRAEREKLRKADVKRISKLVQLAYDKDPRIAAFKREAKIAKEVEKERKRIEKIKIEEAKKAAEAEEARRRAEELAKEKEAKKAADKIKQAEKKKTAAKKKKLREIPESANYWTTDPGKRLPIMANVERICLAATNEQLDEVVERLSGIQTYEEALSILDNTAKKEDAPKKAQTISASKDTHNGPESSAWPEEDLQLLVKASNVFPAGTNRRWFQVAQYMNDHSKINNERTEKEVIKQVKLRQNQISAPVVPLAGQNKLGAGALNDNKAPTAPAPTPIAAPAPTSGIAGDDWSVDEQVKFEQALRANPASDPQRWDKIAQATGRTRKECIQRFKKIAEMIRAKKAEAKS